MHNDYVWTSKVCRGDICHSIIATLAAGTGKNHEELWLGLPAQGFGFICELP
jgi:hypothetical protein